MRTTADEVDLKEVIEKINLKTNKMVSTNQARRAIEALCDIVAESEDTIAIGIWSRIVKRGEARLKRKREKAS